MLCLLYFGFRKNQFMRWIILFLLVVLSSCQTESGNLRREIKALEKNRSDSSRQRLPQLYSSYLDRYPEDSAQAAAYLRKMAQLEYQSLRYVSALQHAYRGLRDYYSVTEETVRTIRFLHQMYDQTIQSPFLLSVLEGAAIKAFPDAFREWPRHDQLEEMIQHKQKTVYADLTQYPNLESANELIAGSELYALILPDSEQTPEFLFSAAEICQGLGVYQRALGLLDWITTRNPNHSKAAPASFLKAFILDEYLNDTLQARTAYENFLATYPNDDFADDAQLLLEALK